MGLLDKISLLVTPNAVKESKLYAVIPVNGNGDLTVVRNTTATRKDVLGNVASVAANVQRINYDAIGGTPYLLLEPQRTNRLLNSAVVANQSITTTAVAQTLSFTGTGTITIGGTFTGSLVGTGVNNRVSLIFTPTSGTLTITVSGSCLLGQLSDGSFVTSYIPTTVSAVTRNADVLTINNIFTNNLITAQGGTFFIEFTNNFSLIRSASSNGISFFDASSNGLIINAAGATSSRLSIKKRLLGVGTTLAQTSTDNIKIVIKWNGATADVFLNGDKVVAATDFSITALQLLTLDGSDVSKSIKSLAVASAPLTDAECITLTTL